MSRRVLVAGGSRGIGLAIAKSFVESGDDVTILARHGGRVYDVGSGMRAFPVGCTIDAGNPREAVILRSCRDIDVLVNTVAIGGGEAQAITHLNLAGAIWMTEIVRENMRAGGAIVHFSGGGVGGPNHAEDPIYTATKAGLVQYVECTAPTLTDITINTVAPGKVATEMTGWVGGTPDRAVALVRFLCGPDARHITGRLLAARDDIERLKQPMGPDDYRLRRVVP